MEVNQAFRKLEGQKFITTVVNGVLYFADQDMDSCDIPEGECADNAQPHDVEENATIILLLDTSITDDFGGNYQWYGLHGYIDTDANFIGTRPPRRPR